MISSINKHNLPTQPTAVLVALLAIIALTGCGEPATGPLSRGGDAARRELRDMVDSYFRNTQQDTSALDALVIIHTKESSIVATTPSLRVDVYLTNEEGFDVTPVALLNSDTLPTEYAFWSSWPSAFGEYVLYEAPESRLTLGFEDESIPLTLAPFPPLLFTHTNAANEAIFFHLIDSTIPYACEVYADSIRCMAEIFSDSSNNSITVGEWMQADNGELLLPRDVLSGFSIDTWILARFTRVVYDVHITPSGKYIGIIRWQDSQKVIAPDE